MQSMQELANAREIVCGLFEQLQLEAYLFEVEPKEPHWEIRVECAVNDVWQSTTFEVDAEQLWASKEPGQTREALLLDWQQHLGSCTRSEDAGR